MVLASFFLFEANRFDWKITHHYNRLKSAPKECIKIESHGDQEYRFACHQQVKGLRQRLVQVSIEPNEINPGQTERERNAADLPSKRCVRRDCNQNFPVQFERFRTGSSPEGKN